LGEEMNKEKTDLSHWIQFLISKKNRCAMWIIGDISACIVILSIILFIIFNLGTTIGFLVSIPLFVLFFLVVYLVLNKFPVVKKCSKLLEDIMKENITDIKKIRDIWFEEEEKMVKNPTNKDIMDRLNLLERRTELITAIFLLYSIAIGFLGIYFNTNEGLHLAIAIICYLFGAMLTIINHFFGKKSKQ
jgi:ABC-type multidrug transport system fused ATPase/permease subunit